MLGAAEDGTALWKSGRPFVVELTLELLRKVERQDKKLFKSFPIIQLNY